MTRAVLSHRLRAHGELIHDTVDMNGQPAAVQLVCLIEQFLK